MERRSISIDIYNKVKERLPIEIINMLPDKPLNLLKYATRVFEINISPNVDDNTAKLMKEHLLSDEEYLVTFYYVMAISFYNKKPVDNPKITIVAAQTGSGKSNLTAKILREDENYVFVDSDKYKHYRFDAIDISNKFPLLYPFLTGPDGYDHAENVYSYALDKKYNIIKETAPSYKKGLLGVNLNRLKDKKYTIYLNILAVSALNSSLSTHERYELQILSGLKTAKLTGIERHNESYNSLIPNVLELTNVKEIEDIKVYKRGRIEKAFDPILIYPSKEYKTPLEAIATERIEDLLVTKQEFEKRYNLVCQQMNNRKALEEQYTQLENLNFEVNSDYAVDIISNSIAELTSIYSVEKDKVKSNKLKEKINILNKVRDEIYLGNAQMINKTIEKKKKGVL